LSHHPDMDPFSTPLQLRTGLPSAIAKNFVPVSKSAIVAIIQNVPFDKVLLPTDLVNDDPDNFSSFIRALGAALIEAVLSKSPRSTSPRKLVALQYSQYEVFPLEQDTLIKPHVKQTDIQAWAKTSHPEPPYK